ncbi:MAG: hypothetical protein J7L32_01665 [Thermoplasmata archaeon]|nr:hypothetical protein [Thermoplasmata archaeon]
MLVVPAYGALVPYKSNPVSDTFEVQKPVIIYPHEVWLPDDWNPMITMENRANNPINGTISIDVNAVLYHNGNETDTHTISTVYQDFEMSEESEFSRSLPYNEWIDDTMQTWKSWCDQAQGCTVRILMKLGVVKP